MVLTQPGADGKLNFSTEKRSFLRAAPLGGGQIWYAVKFLTQVGQD